MKKKQKEIYEGSTNFPDTVPKKITQVIKKRGFFRVIRYFLELVYYKLKPKKQVIIEGEKYKTFYHWYNTTWRGERQVEIPFIIRVIRNTKGNILEVGNVLQHYDNSIKHEIVDKYENGKNVINEDIVNYKSDKKYDLIFSISTLEHVGWDEKPKNPKKFLEALSNLKKLLNKKGRIIFTIPLGYNTFIDNLILNKKIKLQKKIFIKKYGSNWIQKKIKTNKDFNYEDPEKRVVLIGVIKK